MKRPISACCWRLCEPRIPPAVSCPRFSLSLRGARTARKRSYGGLARLDDRIKLCIQPSREGKASAINLFLSEAAGDILILESGDTLPAAGTLERIVAVFDDPRVGMAGGRPVPVNGKDGFLGFAVHPDVAAASPKSRGDHPSSVSWSPSGDASSRSRPIRRWMKPASRR